MPSSRVQILLSRPISSYRLDDVTGINWLQHITNQTPRTNRMCQRGYPSLLSVLGFQTSGNQKAKESRSPRHWHQLWVGKLSALPYRVQSTFLTFLFLFLSSVPWLWCPLGTLQCLPEAADGGLSSFLHSLYTPAS